MEFKIVNNLEDFLKLSESWNQLVDGSVVPFRCHPVVGDVHSSLVEVIRIHSAICSALKSPSARDKNIS